MTLYDRFYRIITVFITNGREILLKNRIYVYDNLKCLLIFLVVTGHFIQKDRMDTHFLHSLSIFIYAFHMPAFAFVSGLFSKHATSDSKTLRERILYFIILSLLCDLLAQLIGMCWSKKGIVKIFGRSNVSWYLFSMALWYGATFLLREVNGGFLFLVLLMLGCFAGYDKRINDFFHLSRTIVFYPFFYLGWRMDPQEWARQAKKPLCRAVALISVLFFAWLCFARTGAMEAVWPLFSGRRAYHKLFFPLYGGIYRLGYYAAITFLIFCLTALTPQGRLPVSWIGERTLQIYFFHDLLFIYFLRNIHFMDRLRAAVGAGKLWQILCICASALILLICSLKPFAYPLKMIQRLCKSRGNEEKDGAAAG